MAMLDAAVGDELQIGGTTIAILPSREKGRFRILHDDDDRVDRVAVQSVRTTQLVRDVSAIRRLAKIPDDLIRSRLTVIDGHQREAADLAENTVDQAAKARHIRERDEWAKAAAVLRLMLAKREIGE